MQKILEQRLNELRTEFDAGQKMLVDLENQQTNLRNTLLRISGAIQVLEELIASEGNVGETPEQTFQETGIAAVQ